jgi:DNA-binding transcriptional MerR regulator
MTTSTRNEQPLGGPAPAARIGSVARLLGLTPRALRYWEQRRLLPPAGRSQGGSRVFTEVQVTAARGVVRLKRAGLSLDDICTLQDDLRRSRTALAGMGDLAAVLAEREEQVRALVSDLQTLQAELAAAREAVLRCDGCHGKSFDHDCIDCLDQRSGQRLPCCLRSILDAAASPRTGSIA